eukprot:12900903-Alexandrium_andersonii.AAC.1
MRQPQGIPEAPAPADPAATMLAEGTTSEPAGRGEGGAGGGALLPLAPDPAAAPPALVAAAAAAAAAVL